MTTRRTKGRKAEPRGVKPLTKQQQQRTFDALLKPRPKKPDPRASIHAAIADRLRAGEPYVEVLDDYDLADRRSEKTLASRMLALASLLEKQGHQKANAAKDLIHCHAPETLWRRAMDVYTEQLRIARRIREIVAKHSKRK